ncbi:hypothetical protein F0330_23920 [Klebsiella pneumoniae]|nr:hypothetical protein F0330_23920 [Klebsiella pneumoniae]HBW8667819.1 hypothetical protein [Klebsiella pneumoniae]HBX8225388.1 hypothetical protein [Klebsiella pneumoniae]
MVIFTRRVKVFAALRSVSSERRYLLFISHKAANKRCSPETETGNAVNLLITILICSHSILVTSG